MTDSTVGHTLTCTQCGGLLHPDQGQVFLTCPFCRSTVYVDKSQVVFHYYLSPTLGEEEAAAFLNRWMSGSKTVKDLDKRALIKPPELRFFPVWFFKYGSWGGRENILIKPAAATSVLELTQLKIPAGDLRNYEPSVQPAVEPTVPLQVASSWVNSPFSSVGDITETALVHIPLFHFTYSFRSREYSAIVEGATGQVMANVFPEKKEAPYQFVAAITIGGYLLLSIIPIYKALAAEDWILGLISGIGLYLGLGIPLFIICILLALIVATVV